MYLSKALADAPFDFLAAGQRSESFWVKLWEELGADLFAKRLNFFFRLDDEWLVVTGTMEFYMTFHSVGNGIIIPTDFHTYFSEG